MHRSRILLLMCGAFIAGIATASWFRISPLILWSVCCVAGISLLMQRQRATIAGLCLIVLVAGAWRTGQTLSRDSSLWEFAADRPTVTLTGYTDGDFESTVRGGRFTFRVLQVAYDDTIAAVDDRVLVSGPGWIRPRQGQWLDISGKLQRANTFDNFDYASYLAKDGIHAVMYFPTYSVPLGYQKPWDARVRAWVTGRLAVVRVSLMESLTQSVSQPEAGYLAGLLVGAKGNVSDELKESFARTGTSHIVALSGFNITIIVTMLAGLLAPLGRRRSYWLSVLAIALFTVMVGASASVVRAAVMGVLAMTATRLGRLSDAGVAMAATAAAMCAYNPALLRWDVGFQLSFLAFAGIVYIQPLIGPYALRVLRWPSLATLVSTTLAAQVLVLPLLLFVFGMLAVYTLPVNVFVLPLVPLAMALGFATAVAGLVWSWAGVFVGQMAWLVAAVQLGVIRFAASLRSAALELPLSAPAMIALYVALATWLFSLYRGRRKSPVGSG